MEADGHYFGHTKLGGFIEVKDGSDEDRKAKAEKDHPLSCLY